MLGERAGGILRTERELARRLLQNPAIEAVPVVFMGGEAAGRILALERADALKITEETAIPDRRDKDMVSRTVAAGSSDDLVTSPTESSDDLIANQVPLSDGTPMPELPQRRMRIRAGFRWFARKLVNLAPAASREDLRLVLIHAREVVRKTLRPGGSAGAPVEPSEELAPGDEMQPADAPVLLDEEAIRRGEVTRLMGAICGRGLEIGWPGVGEVLWTCGHYGAFVPVRLIAEARQRFGFSCVAVCYDLIRNEHPEWNPNAMTKTVWDCIIADLIDATDRILCISQYTKARLLAYAAQSNLGRLEARVITLGCDLLPTAAALPQQLAGRRFALAVGSVEKRKNLGMLVRIWEELQNRPDFALILVLVGRAAEWDEAAVHEVEASPLLGQTILWFDVCPDDVLGLLYRRADALLYPSFTEGWGLPVTEALAVGTPVVASNGGAIPEAASGFANLLDPRDERAWQSAVLDVAASPPARLPQMRPHAWDTAGATVAAHLIDVARALTQ